MAFQDFFEGDGAFFSGVDAIEGAFGEIEVLEVLEVFEEGLADVEGFGAAGAAGEFFEAVFDGEGEANGQHGNLAIQV